MGTSNLNGPGAALAGGAVEVICITGVAVLVHIILEEYRNLALECRSLELISRRFISGDRFERFGRFSGEDPQTRHIGINLESRLRRVGCDL